MSGFDELGVDELGFDYSSLLKGAGGLLSGVSEGFGDKGGGGAAAVMEKVRQEEAQRKAEKSAATMKYVLIGVLGLVGVGALVFLLRRPPAP